MITYSAIRVAPSSQLDPGRAGPEAVARLLDAASDERSQQGDRDGRDNERHDRAGVRESRQPRPVSPRWHCPTSAARSDRFSTRPGMLTIIPDIDADEGAWPDGRHEAMLMTP
jgi:hypothetical protein